jgi:hypothetical protein
MVQTVATSKHEDFNLVFTNHGTEDGIYPLKEIAEHKTKIKDLLYNMQKNLQRSYVFNLLKT